MCGILAIIGKGKDQELVKTSSKRMSHRGPDESDLQVTKNGHILSHERLSIIDLHSGRQPIQGSSSAWMIHNGEIYNHQELRDGVLKHHTFRTKSDSEVIVHLYEEFGYDFLNVLDGDFAFVVINGDDYIAGRDPMGVKPLYYGLDERGRMYFASEMKPIADQCKTFFTFPPGHYYTPKTGFVKYYKPEYCDYKKATNTLDLKLIRDSLTEATRKRLMSDVPIGVLLSGGLDSSLTSSIASRLLKEKGKTLHSFSIGLDENAPDAKAARKVAEFLGTKHHEVHFTIEQGIEILDKLIWHLETYDVTSVRASTPMYFLSKAITDMGIKVVLSGEGADEIFGGYLYFRNAPTTEDFQKETIERVQKLFTADLLRADKSTMAHGLEARVPFLDKAFLDVAMLVKPEEKQPKTYGGKEKYILRKAFDTPDNPYLPDEVLWRQKEQFSDGVGYNWIDQLIEYCASKVTDKQLELAKELYSYNTPTTKEAYYYRTIFHKYYPQQSAAETVRKWIPKWQENQDPSGRANAAHVQADLEIAKASILH
ncbi:asparagine synthase B [Flavobacterium psychrophilum]|uniref:asparagine synthase (glutamine-hydrolyzing) n=1 Tax=Flavobacterium psychrophilum TaxID=96345 RepID=A0A7U2RAE3_FLAPS|nr:asparagine synthase B [Flavobacterium psychrophilum]EKT3966141.1 asparagine synthase B [Flavobacterium psychrophilum]EKT4499136.1 asparagine synthase B [Flavobacterium psychrophilum]ELI6455370.1 asparagine synthase B [Flavobacterium psychrophilum]ELM3650680.1 asparagine synthase B [Flavobacterium psychrophilum]ELM3671449.1 asparagine synthase B [Flavobacterium psychrophilum]